LPPFPTNASKQSFDSPDYIEKNWNYGLSFQGDIGFTTLKLHAI